MSDYIENTNYLSKEDIAKGDEGSSYQINRSSELDELAGKLSDDTLRDNCETFLPKSENNKARMSDLLNGMCMMFNLMRRANFQPIFLVMRQWDWRTVNGFYFFIGTHQHIKARLLKLIEDEPKNSRWH